MKPTLEEVKEYFKNAETIESLYGKKFENKYEFNYSKDNDAIYAKEGDFMVWNEGQYAKILTYKEQKFEITKEQILKYNMKDEFPEVFKKELEVGKYYKNLTYEGSWLFYDGKINKKGTAYTSYGCIYSGSWIDEDESGNWNISNEYYEMTLQEIETVLKNEWIKNNKNIFEIDNSNICELGDKYKISNNPSYRYWEINNMFTVDEVCVFLNGKFANIIEIETITIQEAEKLLNKKIV